MPNQRAVCGISLLIWIFTLSLPWRARAEFSSFCHSALYWASCFTRRMGGAGLATPVRHSMAAQAWNTRSSPAGASHRARPISPANVRPLDHLEPEGFAAGGAAARTRDASAGPAHGRTHHRGRLQGRGFRAVSCRSSRHRHPRCKPPALAAPGLRRRFGLRGARTIADAASRARPSFGGTAALPRRGSGRSRVLGGTQRGAADRHRLRPLRAAARLARCRPRPRWRPSGSCSPSGSAEWDRADMAARHRRILQGEEPNSRNPERSGAGMTRNCRHRAPGWPASPARGFLADAGREGDRARQGGAASAGAWPRAASCSLRAKTAFDHGGAIRHRRASRNSPRRLQLWAMPRPGGTSAPRIRAFVGRPGNVGHRPPPWLPGWTCASARRSRA